MMMLCHFDKYKSDLEQLYYVFGRLCYLQNQEKVHGSSVQFLRKVIRTNSHFHTDDFEDCYDYDSSCAEVDAYLDGSRYEAFSEEDDHPRQEDETYSYMGYDQDLIDELFDGDEELAWNLD